MATQRFRIRTPQRTAELEVAAPFFVVGRGEPYAVFREDPDLAREQFAVVEAADGYVLKDLGAPSGVALNGRRLSRYEEVPLAPGDEVVAAGTTLTLLREADPTEPSPRETVTLTPVEAAEDGASEPPDAVDGEATLELERPGPGDEGDEGDADAEAELLA